MVEAVGRSVGLSPAAGGGGAVLIEGTVAGLLVLAGVVQDVPRRVVGVREHLLGDFQLLRLGVLQKQSRSEQGTARQGKSGQRRAKQKRAEQSMAEEGRAWQSKAEHVRARQSRVVAMSWDDFVDSERTVKGESFCSCTAGIDGSE